MSLLTTWGYTLEEIDRLPGFLSEEEYSEFTADKFAGDARILANIAAASSAVRNYCGWHVFPALTCKLSTTFYDKRIATVWGGILIQLPATYVSEVQSITIGGTAYTTFVSENDGIVRVYDVAWSGIKNWTQIEVVYTAGVPKEMISGIKELVAHRVSHAMANSYGVQSEAAGGVSVTYNANWTNSARATALPDDNKEVLGPYRLKGVF